MGLLGRKKVPSFGNACKDTTSRNLKKVSEVFFSTFIKSLLARHNDAGGAVQRHYLALNIEVLHTRQHAGQLLGKRRVAASLCAAHWFNINIASIERIEPAAAAVDIQTKAQVAILAKLEDIICRCVFRHLACGLYGYDAPIAFQQLRGIVGKTGARQGQCRQ